jgi:hypothetical protein
MDVEARIDRLLDTTQISPKLLMPMPRLALADDCSSENVLRGEECGPRGVCNRGFVAPLASAAMGESAAYGPAPESGSSRPHSAQWLIGLVRVHEERSNVTHFRRKIGIAAELERFDVAAACARSIASRLWEESSSRLPRRPLPYFRKSAWTPASRPVLK